MYIKMRLVPVLAALSVGLAVSAGLVGAQPGDKKADTDGKATGGKADPVAKTVHTLAAAHHMAQYGREERVPEALLLAARVIGTTDTRRVDPKDIKAKDTKTADELEEAKGLIQEALKMADTDAIKALAETTREAIKERKRGALPGPRRINGRMGPGDSSDVFRVVFRGGQQAVVSVIANPSYADVDVDIIDEQTFQVVRSDVSTSVNAHVAFFPARTQGYIIRLKNFRSQVSVNYTVYTN